MSTTIQGLLNGLDQATTEAQAQKIVNDKLEAKRRKHQAAEDARYARLAGFADNKLAKLDRALRPSEERIAQYERELAKIVKIIKSLPDAPFKVKRTDTGSHLSGIAAFRDRPDYLTYGTCDFDRDERIAEETAFQAAAGRKLPHFIRSRENYDVTRNIESFFKEREVVYTFVGPKNAEDPRNDYRHTLKLAFIGASVTTPWKAQIATVKDHWSAPRSGSGLGEKSFARAVADLGKWVTAEAPSCADAFIAACAKLKAEEEELHLHRSVYGHTRYLERPQDDIKGRMDDLVERIKLAQDRLASGKTPGFGVFK